MLPPQCVVDGRSSSPWASCDAAGVAGGVAATIAVASKSKEAVRVGWAEGDSSTGGGTGEAWVGTDGEIRGKPRRL